MDNKEKAKPMVQVIRIDEARICDHLGEMVRGTVEETLKAMLDAEADQLCGAGKYERTEGRNDTRAGSYKRSLDAKAGSVKLKIPKLRRRIRFVGAFPDGKSCLHLAALHRGHPLVQSI